MLSSNDIVYRLVISCNDYMNLLENKNRTTPKHRQIQNSIPVTKTELYNFIELSLLLAHHKFPKLWKVFSNWLSIYNSPIFKNIMSGRCYEYILRMFHANKIPNVSPETRNRLSRVREVVNKLLVNFQNAYHLYPTFIV